MGQIQFIFQERGLDFGQLQDVEEFLKDCLSLLSQQRKKLNALIDQTPDTVLGISLLIKQQDMLDTFQAFKQDPSMLFMNKILKVRQKSLNSVYISRYQNFFLRRLDGFQIVQELFVSAFAGGPGGMLDSDGQW